MALHGADTETKTDGGTKRKSVINYPSVLLLFSLIFFFLNGTYHHKHFPPVSAVRLTDCVINKCYSLTPFNAPTVPKLGSLSPRTWPFPHKHMVRHGREAGSSSLPCSVYADRCSADLSRMLVNTSLPQSNSFECSQHSAKCSIFPPPSNVL